MATLTRDQQAALVARIRTGDSTAWDELYAYTAPFLHKALFKLADAETIDDLVQDTMFRAYRKLDQFGGDSSFTTWAISIGQNLAIMQLRKAARERQYVAVSLDEQLSDVEGSSWAVEPGYSDRTIERNEAYTLIHTALRSCSAPQQQAIQLQLDGLSYEEIAAAMDTTVANVKSHISRGKSTMAAKLTT